MTFGAKWQEIIHNFYILISITNKNYFFKYIKVIYDIDENEFTQEIIELAEDLIIKK